MNVFLWIVAALLAVVFLASGVTKLVRWKEELVASGQAALGGLGAGVIRTVAVFEVLAALGLVLLMLGAAIIHLRRKETSGIAVTVVLLVLAVVVAWGRFGPQSFVA